MANRYWVGGTAAWDGTAGTKWALTSGGAGGQAVPTSADDVFFDASSGANTVTISTGNTGAKSITCTGFTGTLAGTAAITVSGDLTLVAGMTYSYTGTITINATATLITAGKTTGSVTINGAGITVTLGDAFTMKGGYSFTLTQGTFSTANFSFSPYTLSSSNTNTRVLNLGSSTVTLAAITFTTSTNMTLNAGTSTINATVNNAVYDLGGFTYNNFSFTVTNTFTHNLNGANTFANFTIAGATVSGISQMILGGNQTITGTLTVNAASNGSCRRSFISDTLGTARTITAAAVVLNDVDFQDITGAGAATWSGTRLGNAGGNTNITFPVAKTVYYSAATAGQWLGTSWATSSGGATSGNNYPLPQDTAVIDDNSGTGTLTLQSGAAGFIIVPILSAGTRTITLTLNHGSTISPFLGSITLSSAITPSGTGTILLENRSGTLNITSAGKTWTQAFNIQSIGATVRLIDNCTTSNTVTSTNGTFDLNGQTATVASYVTAAGTKNLTFNGGTIVVSNATTTAWNNAAPTGYTTTAGTGTGKISMTAATAKTFVGGGSTYNCTLSNDGAGALTITGSNTFTTLANGVQPTTFTFTAATTTTVSNFSVSGTAGNLVTINSTGAAATLSKSSGTVSCDYLSITNSTATGGAAWYAGANSTDGGNNSGWVFTVPPAPPSATGNFLMFF